MNINNIHVLSRGVLIVESHILLCKTVDLVKNFYFLPGGHIEHSESAKAALQREFVEESGESCEVLKFLGCLEYSFVPGEHSVCHNHEYNFVFAVSSNSLHPTRLVKRMEDNIELLWLPLDKMEELDFRPDPLKQLIHSWTESGDGQTFCSRILETSVTDF